jgi:hypothetical protein
VLEQPQHPYARVGVKELKELAAILSRLQEITSKIE